MKHRNYNRNGNYFHRAKVRKHGYGVRDLGTMELVLNKAIAKSDTTFQDDLVDDLAKRFAHQNIIFNEIDKEMQKLRMPIPITSLPVHEKSEDQVRKEIQDKLKAVI